MITWKIASPEDAASVAKIGKTTFYETWRAVNTEEDMQLYLKEAFDDQKIKDDISDSARNLFILARTDNHDIGYAKMRRDRTYDEFEGEKAMEVERIYVMQEYQKKKIGKLLMDRCIELAKQENQQWLWLGVNEDNKKAINFYNNYGFTVFGTKQFILGTAIDEDLLMKLKLTP